MCPIKHGWFGQSSLVVCRDGILFPYFHSAEGLRTTESGASPTSRGPWKTHPTLVRGSGSLGGNAPMGAVVTGCLKYIELMTLVQQSHFEKAHFQRRRLP